MADPTSTGVTDRILLNCPRCPAQMMVPRLPFDYPEAVRVEIPCDQHHTGDHVETFYYDAEGKHICRAADLPA